MGRICVFDTSVATLNVGDEIIMDSVRRELDSIFKKDMILSIPSHEKINRISHIRIKMSKNLFVGGTNLLTSNMFKFNPQWNIGIKDTFFVKEAVLLGVGWRKYNEKTNIYTKFLLKRVLNKEKCHAVRDNFTKKKLEELGIKNAINTGCPTLWNLTEEHCKNIKKNKSKNVVCTFTDYDKDIEKDKEIARILLKNYEKVYCWIQGSSDEEYIKTISDRFIVINPKLKEYDNVLEKNNDIDFVGTRLHAGIRAMQKGRRSIIISIDNRAREMGKDFNLNIIERKDVANLEQLINSNFETKIKLNWSEIEMWRNQFKNE